MSHHVGLVVGCTHGTCSAALRSAGCLQDDGLFAAAPAVSGGMSGAARSQPHGRHGGGGSGSDPYSSSAHRLAIFPAGHSNEYGGNGLLVSLCGCATIESCFERGAGDRRGAFPFLGVGRMAFGSSSCHHASSRKPKRM
jgi:hypothetical protein